MSESTQSLLTLLGLIFGGVIIFVVVLLWWVDRYIDRLFDHDNQTLD